MFTNERKITVGIVGIGPRGAAIFEQIAKRAHKFPTYFFQIFLFEPQNLGEGCHRSDQSEAFLMNTSASQLALLGSSSDLKEHELNFQSWLANNVCLNTQNSNNTAISHGYYPRALFGKYLSDSFNSLLRNCPNNLHWTHVSKPVIDIEYSTDTLWSLSTAEKSYADIDFVHITTGHGTPRANHPRPSNKLPSLIECSYPISTTLKKISATHTVALEGMGLTSFDIVAELTEQRGGRFIPKGNGLLQYLPSGKEPFIVAFSRSGLPLRAKPKGQDNPRQKVQPAFLTDSTINNLLCRAPLDFEKDVLPLIKLEMKHIYYKTLLKNNYKYEAVMSFNSLSSYLSLLDKSLPYGQRFSFDKMCSPLSQAEKSTYKNYSESLLSHLEDDFLQAELGTCNSPAKAAENLLRDLRDVFSQLIDFKNISGTSHQWLYQFFLPKMKQLSIGPPRVRIAQWLALMEAGVLKIDLGPNITCEKTQDGWKLQSRICKRQVVQADTLIQARLPIVDSDKTNLVNRMFEKGYAVPFDNDGFKTGGIEVSKSFNVINHENVEINTLWATGVLTEGARFYTFSLPSPGQSSRFTQDAHTAVESMFSQLIKSSQLTREAG